MGCNGAIELVAHATLQEFDVNTGHERRAKALAANTVKHHEETGYNAYRTSQLSSTENWVKAGFSEAAAKNYLDAINGALSNPNMASDFKIPGANGYSSVVLDRELARYLAGEITVDEALANIEAGWEEITEDFGRDSQIKAQGLALGGG